MEHARKLTDMTPEEVRTTFPYGGYVGFIVESGPPLEFWRKPVPDPMRWSLKSPFEGRFFCAVYNTPHEGAEPVLWWSVGLISVGQRIALEAS